MLGQERGRGRKERARRVARQGWNWRQMRGLSGPVVWRTTATCSDRACPGYGTKGTVCSTNRHLRSIPELEQEVVRVIKDLAAEGRTMLIVTHDMRLAADVSDHVVFLHQGLIEEEGHPDAVVRHPEIRSACSSFSARTKAA